MNKSLVGLCGSLFLALIGIISRLKAHAIAWSNFGGSYSGPASETSWGRQETAIGEIAVVLMAVGILLFVVTYIHWLFAKESVK